MATLDEAMELLRERATEQRLADLSKWGIPSRHAIGVPVKDIRAVAKLVGTDHALAEELWSTGIYEARMLTSFVGDPATLTAEQMDSWMADVDDWSLCDTLCFGFFDRSNHAWGRVDAWESDERLYVRRGAFALLWALGSHARDAAPEEFIARLPACERAASDPRPHVRKAVDMALRSIARRGPDVHAAVAETAGRLAASDDRGAAAIGRAVARRI
ncbi:DNA alkylation repair protein [Demequina sp. NBRC 110056]|uniref:DNA alkylation repair protein n=1 Tax=Demequina sp. NBRC 110056 TaxID=1570345 RepID=UPI000A022094|nr:DNA alkylation repair protein [Demequina sp. NBRC 110056]